MLQKSQMKKKIPDQKDKSHGREPASVGGNFQKISRTEILRGVKTATNYFTLQLK